MVRVSVPIEGRPYDVVVGAGVMGEASAHLPELPKAERAFVVSDRTVADLWFDELARALRDRRLDPVLLAVPSGEAAKTLQVYAALLHQLATQEAHRDDVVVGLGGGAIGDLAGFVAATYMRGVPYVAVPTTLTGQVDAAIGGKTAVNLPEGKNLVGTFTQPRAVLEDVLALATLPDRDFRSGLAEVAKYALTLDLELLASLEADPSPTLERDPGALEELVARCVRAKAATVAADERDAGPRLFLNYGHTLGHALERLDAFAGRSHGEAIAIGMVFAARLAVALGVADAALIGRTVRLLSSLGLPTAGALPPSENVMAAFGLDKKWLGGARFVVLEDVGRPRVVDDVPLETLRILLDEMGAAA